jgi:hypothetical protein
VMMLDSASAESAQLRQSGGVSRRGMFRIGTAFIATVAALSTPKSVWAGNCGTPCCNLAHCNMCAPNGGCSGGWVCPPGYQDSWWMCSSGGHTCTCGECTLGTNCHASPWASCSVAYCY